MTFPLTTEQTVVDLCDNGMSFVITDVTVSLTFVILLKIPAYVAHSYSTLESYYRASNAKSGISNYAPLFLSFQFSRKRRVFSIENP